MALIMKIDPRDDAKTWNLPKTEETQLDRMNAIERPFEAARSALLACQEHFGSESLKSVELLSKYDPQMILMLTTRDDNPRWLGVRIVSPNDEHLKEASDIYIKRLGELGSQNDASNVQLLAMHVTEQNPTTRIIRCISGFINKDVTETHTLGVLERLRGISDARASIQKNSLDGSADLFDLATKTAEELEGVNVLDARSSTKHLSALVQNSDGDMWIEYRTVPTIDLADKSNASIIISHITEDAESMLAHNPNAPDFLVWKNANGGPCGIAKRDANA